MVLSKTYKRTFNKEKLRGYMATQNITISGLAERIGIPMETLKWVFRTKKVFSADYVLSIAATGIPIEEMSVPFNEDGARKEILETLGFEDTEKMPPKAELMEAFLALGKKSPKRAARTMIALSFGDHLPGK